MHHFHRIVNSFETIAEALVEQEDFDNITVLGEDITFQAERVSKHATHMYCWLSDIPGIFAYKIVVQYLISPVQISVTNAKTSGVDFQPGKTPIVCTS